MGLVPRQHDREPVQRCHEDARTLIWTFVSGRETTVRCAQAIVGNGYDGAADD